MSGRPLLPPAMLSAAVTAAVTVTGCAGTHESSRMGSPTPILVTEYRLRPSDLRVQGSGPVDLLVTNVGLRVHDLEIASDGATVAETPPLAPGQSATIDIRLPPGRYTLASEVDNDADLGATGTLVVAPSR